MPSPPNCSGACDSWCAAGPRVESVRCVQGGRDWRGSAAAAPEVVPNGGCVSWSPVYARTAPVRVPRRVSVAFIHRFGSTRNSHPHFHGVVIDDGVFDAVAGGTIVRAATATSVCWCERLLAGNFGGDDQRQELAGSSPSTPTFQCRVKTSEQSLGACGSTPGPDPKPSPTVLRAGHRDSLKPPYKL